MVHNVTLSCNVKKTYFIASNRFETKSKKSLSIAARAKNQDSIAVRKRLLAKRKSLTSFLVHNALLKRVIPTPFKLAS